MNKKLIYALILIALVTVVAILTGGTVDLDLFGIKHVRMDMSLGLFLFAGLGVVIGLLLR